MVTQGIPVHITGKTLTVKAIEWKTIRMDRQTDIWKGYRSIRRDGQTDIYMAM